MTYFEKQDVMLLAGASIINTTVPSLLLLQVGWAGYLAIWTLVGSIGCLYASYRLFRDV